MTDEEGSDPENLEQAIVTCKKYGMRVYCVGDSAPFGRKTVEAPFVMENGETVIGVMQKGPESKYAELVRLGFWGTNSYDLDDMSSGFGPYGLTRLCSETNGLYFITDNGRGFDASVPEGTGDHYGLITMRERAQQAGGRLEFASSPGGGTTVTASVPVRFDADASGDDE